MASRHHSLDLSEIADITDMLLGFQEHNSCLVSLGVTVEAEGKHRSLVISVEAWTTDSNRTGAPLLASVSVKCSALNLRNWNSALTHALYALDFQLALLELGHAEPKKQ